MGWTDERVTVLDRVNVRNLSAAKRELGSVYLTAPQSAWRLRRNSALVRRVVSTREPLSNRCRGVRSAGHDARVLRE